jgi:hypothetical protein
MAGPYDAKEVVSETRNAASMAERDRIDLARVGKKEVLKVRFRPNLREM